MKNFLKCSVRLFALTIIGLGFLFSSCKKEGPQGPAGPSGKDGNANVKNQTIFINANEWVYSAGACKVTKLVPEITSDIISKGALMVYIEGEPSGSWEALPASWGDPSGLVITWGYTMETGKLHLLVTLNDNITLPAGSILSNSYKLVLIAGSARAANPDVNYSNYQEVTSTFQLSE
jgi:hypothetical protein